MNETPREPAEQSPPPLSNVSPSNDLSGRCLGDFQLLRRLGRGAMAEVYLAEQISLKRRVALKILKPELAADRHYLQRFRLEAQAAASLVHPNIVQIYEVGCVEGLHYIAQEYVPGQNLREYLARNPPLNLSRALSIMYQVASALAKAGEQGVVHRDIKPENIMLTAGGEVKVADFGLARLSRADTAHDLTQIGTTLGTPLYMSPEQIEGKPLDPRSDIYSFGVTCYQMLSGTPPFSGETALGVAVQHLRGRPRPLESLRPDLPPALCRLVHQMLAKDPSQRFSSAHELLRELRRLQREHFGEEWPAELPAWDVPLAASPVEQPTSITRELDELMKTAAQLHRERRKRRLFVVMILPAFIAGGWLAWWTTVPASLLAEAERVPPAMPPKQANVLRQWYLAGQLGTEAAWQSVIHYFPEKKDFVLRAKQQLALNYLREGEFDRAMTIFDELAELGDDQPEFRAFGLAGQCGILSLRGRYHESNAVLAQLLPIRDKLVSEPMRRLVENALRKNRAYLGRQAAEDWDRWLEEHFGND